MWEYVTSRLGRNNDSGCFERERELTETGPQCNVNVSTATGAKEQEIARFNV